LGVGHEGIYVKPQQMATYLAFVEKQVFFQICLCKSGLLSRETSKIKFIFSDGKLIRFESNFIFHQKNFFAFCCSLCLSQICLHMPAWESWRAPRHGTGAHCARPAARSFGSLAISSWCAPASSVLGLSYTCWPGTRFPATAT
jgi:hypothetical protein